MFCSPSSSLNISLLLIFKHLCLSFSNQQVLQENFYLCDLILFHFIIFLYFSDIKGKRQSEFKKHTLFIQFSLLLMCQRENYCMFYHCEDRKMYHEFTASFTTFKIVCCLKPHGVRDNKNTFCKVIRDKKPLSFHCLLPVVTNLIYFITSERGANVHPPTHVPI